MVKFKESIWGLNPRAIEIDIFTPSVEWDRRFHEQDADFPNVFPAIVAFEDYGRKLVVHIFHGAIELKPEPEVLIQDLSTETKDG